MVRGSFLLFGAAVALTAVSCGSPTVERTTSEQQAIVNGSEDIDDPAVVFVVINNQGQLTVGTGTVVSPHVVLTAGHVVTGNTGAVYRVFFGRNWRDGGSASDEWLEVSDMHADPGFNSRISTSTRDVGVLILSSPAPMAPVLFNRRPADPSWVGALIRMVGYGVTSGADISGASAGTRREAVATVTNLYALTFASSMGSTPCGGDSGGPAFMNLNGTQTLVGVVSNGDAACSGASFARVDASAALVDQWINEADPGFLPDAGRDAAESGAELVDDAGVDDVVTVEASEPPPDPNPEPVGDAPSSGGCAMSTNSMHSRGHAWSLTAIGIAATALLNRRARFVATRARRAGCCTRSR
jgi:hypothetical protein